MKKSINIITDFDGKKVVLINDVRFKSRRNIDWEKVVFSARMLVRRDENGRMYLYDFVRTKKETSSPLE